MLAPRAEARTLLRVPAEDLASRFRAVRAATERLVEPLSDEDCAIQSMPDASPTKWHLAHTTWFFETLVLERQPGYRSPHPAYRELFNSYYQSLGEPYPRPRRGLLSRPSLDQVHSYRAQVDDAILSLLEQGEPRDPALTDVIELGLQHEQQHQELLVTDVKHLLSCNPLGPAYLEKAESPPGGDPAPVEWLAFEPGLGAIGHDGPGFAFDNERPRHRVFVRPFALASRPATNREYLAFVEDGGYERPELWLSDGFAALGRGGWRAPLYWRRGPEGWSALTVAGVRPVRAEEPVCHVSYFEADAFARWSGARLPSEAEWELAAAGAPVEGHFAESGYFHPAPTRPRPGRPTALFGDVWEWTASAYAPYPGFRPLSGPLGEYNGKFMCSQLVLRGGSCATPASHIRPTYRNFFHPHQRWPFTGIRLADGA